MKTNRIVIEGHSAVTLRFTKELMKALSGCNMHWLGQPVFNAVCMEDAVKDDPIIISVHTDCGNDHHHHDAHLVAHASEVLEEKLKYLEGTEILVEEVHTALRLRTH